MDAGSEITRARVVRISAGAPSEIESAVESAASELAVGVRTTLEDLNQWGGPPTRAEMIGAPSVSMTLVGGHLIIVVTVAWRITKD